MITEPLVVRGSTIVQAWTTAAELLATKGDRFNLTIHITDPSAVAESEIGHYDVRKVEPKIRQSVYDVANTIFPTEHRFHTRSPREFFAHYHKVYLRGQRRHPGTWGTYFLRLISFGAAGENQLERIIAALTNWNCSPRAAFVLHLSGPNLDRPRPLGAPCWQYGEFIRDNEKSLSFVAVYRSQDYFEKALGNFVGLARLLRWVCAKAGMNVGTLTCLSTYATLQGKSSKTLRLLGK